MFKIESLREEEVKTLSLSENLFHEALKYKPESKARFHVKNDKGEDFDIVYWDNDEDIEPRDTYPSYIKPPFMAKYFNYDENDKATLYLSFFDGLNNMVFEELNEYTIAISKVILQFTDMEIWCADDRIRWFIDENPRLHILEELPDDIYEDDCFYIQEQFQGRILMRIFRLNHRIRKQLWVRYWEKRLLKYRKALMTVSLCRKRIAGDFVSAFLLLSL